MRVRHSKSCGGSSCLPISGLEVLQEIKDACKVRDALDLEFCAVGTFLIGHDKMEDPILLPVYLQLSEFRKSILYHSNSLSV